METATVYPQLVSEFIRKEKLPRAYGEDVEQILPPLIAAALKMPDSKNAMSVLGINGSQGSGKTTLARLLATLLEAAGRRVVSLSLDDFYLDREQREELATRVHPLLASRGVPGTHDIELALSTVNKLRELQSEQSLSLPGFDKASDEPVPHAQRQRAVGPVDVLILEGWCLACPPQADNELEIPINQLEQHEDSDGRWRRWVNEQLAGDYQTLFAQLDQLVFLAAPGMEQVMEWRQLQEHKLRDRIEKPNRSMSDAQIIRFVQHFERLTRLCLQTLPKQAQWIIDLDRDHRMTRLRQGQI